MNTLRMLGLATALGVATSLTAQAAQDERDQAATQQATPPAAGQQSNAPPAPEPDAASSRHQREVTGREDTQESPTTAGSDPSAAGSPHQRGAVAGGSGSRDEDASDKASGQSSGQDRQVAGTSKPKDKLVGLPVESANGESIGSVVDIVRSKDGDPEYAVLSMDNDTTAVPYDSVSSMVRDGKVVMNAERLAGAPKVKQSEWLDQTQSNWRNEADRYWGNTRTASPGEAEDGSGTTRR